MRQIGIDEMKDLELDILVNFAEYCDNHSLRYYLYAGTLLGAVRHQGFIPWDDDIDVVMPRPDYERFLAMTQEAPVAEHIDVVSIQTDENRFCPFAKVIDSRTDGHEAHLGKEFHNGIWIDVFPLDGVPEDMDERKKFIASQQKDIKLLSRCSRPLIFTWNPLKLAKRIIIYTLYHHVDYRVVATRLENNAQKYRYDDCRYIGVTAFGGGHNNVIEKDGFEDVVMLPFEGHSFKVPGTYKQYLSHLFGPDYMTPPPISKRTQAHLYTGWWKDGAQ